MTGKNFNITFKKALERARLYNSAAAVYNRYNSIKRRRIYKKMKETGEAPLPERFIFEPTQRCNLRCKMCFFNRDMTVKPNELSLDEIKKVFGSIKSARFVNAVGGEVMVRPDFFDILDYFKSIGLEIQIGSNGTLINEKNTDRLTSNPNITAITFSIDGTKELHNSIRRTDFAFDSAIRGIKLVKDRIPAYVVTVLMDENVNQLPDIVRLMKEIDAGDITFEYERKYTDDDLEESSKAMDLPIEDFPVSISKSKNRDYPASLLREKLEECMRLGKELGVKVGLFPKFLYDDLDNCYNETLRANRKFMCRHLFIGRIDPQGNLIHCYAIRKAFGNLLEKPFGEVWNSNETKEFRKRLLNNNLLPICETCLYMERV